MSVAAAWDRTSNTMVLRPGQISSNAQGEATFIHLECLARGEVKDTILVSLVILFKMDKVVTIL